MKWVLVNTDGRALREVEASSLAEARFRLAPIPQGASVVTHDSYREALRLGVSFRPMHPSQRTGQRAAINTELRKAIAEGVPKGMRLADIARHFGVTPQRVGELRAKLKLEQPMDYKRRLILAAHAEGLSNVRIAERVRCSLSTVADTLKANGLTKHRRTPRVNTDGTARRRERYKVHHLTPAD